MKTDFNIQSHIITDEFSYFFYGGGVKILEGVGGWWW